MQIASERPAVNSKRPNPSTSVAVRIDEVKIYEKRTLRAFINFTIADLGLRINGAMIHEKEGKRWVGMPAREYVSEGEKHWSPIVDFVSKESRDVMNDAVLAAYDRYKTTTGGRP
jgi:DNA-binding cell septation regulator SpoVG